MIKDSQLNKQISRIAVLIAVIGTIIAIKNSNIHLPGNFKDYKPEQPIDFSHQLHAGEMNISCMYCHFGAEDSKHAGIPPVNVCMNCHKYVSNTNNEVRLADKEKRKLKVSDEIKKIYDAFESAKSSDEKNVEWVKVHNLPEFVYFSHKPHISAGLACAKCHGGVESMARVKQENDLSMGWCLDCHRQDHESLDNSKYRKMQLQDCATCHY